MTARVDTRLARRVRAELSLLDCMRDQDETLVKTCSCFECIVKSALAAARQVLRLNGLCQCELVDYPDALKGSQ